MYSFPTSLQVPVQVLSGINKNKNLKFMKVVNNTSTTILQTIQCLHSTGIVIDMMF